MGEVECIRRYCKIARGIGRMHILRYNDKIIPCCSKDIGEVERDASGNSKTVRGWGQGVVKKCLKAWRR